jgi:hypothetical protein
MKDFFLAVCVLAFVAGSGMAQSLEDRLKQIEANNAALARRLSAVEAKVDQLWSVVHPPRPAGAVNDPYLMTDWATFVSVVRSGGNTGLVVGPVADPWKMSYMVHFEAPAQWMGLETGTYLPFVDYEGKIGYHPNTSLKANTTVCGPNGCAVNVSSADASQSCGQNSVRFPSLFPRLRRR